MMKLQELTEEELQQVTGGTDVMTATVDSRTAYIDSTSISLGKGVSPTAMIVPGVCIEYDYASKKCIRMNNDQYTGK